MLRAVRFEEQVGEETASILKARREGSLLLKSILTQCNAYIIPIITSQPSSTYPLLLNRILVLLTTLNYKVDKNLQEHLKSQLWFK